MANSFPGNLPRAVELEKLKILTDTIIENLGVVPEVYKAGRYGIGSNTGAILEELGYRIDTSIRPRRDYSEHGGPNFRFCGPDPRWLGPSGTILELPLSCGFTGNLRSKGGAIYPAIDTRLGRRLHLPGIMSRAALLNKVDLTPEGTTLREAMSLTNAMLADGNKVFVLAYHSPSLEPGHTPYVRSKHELEVFLAWLEGYCDFFFGEAGGRAATPQEIYELAVRARDIPD